MRPAYCTAGGGGLVIMGTLNEACVLYCRGGGGVRGGAKSKKSIFF